MGEKDFTAAKWSEEEILASLSRQIEAETPDILEHLMEQINPVQPGKQDGKYVRKRRRRFFTALAGMAAMLAVCFGVLFHAGQVASIIQIDVNPSVELSVDRKDQVMEARALNSDGQRVLEGMELKKVNADVAVNAIIGSMVKQGYFSDSQSAVLVTVINKDPAKSQELGQRIASDINQTFLSQNRQVRIYNQGLVSGENVEKQAKQYGVSQGKMAFIDKLIQQDPTLSREQLSQMTIAQLEQVIVNRKLDLSGMEEYDRDDSISENIEEIIEEIDENSSESIHKDSDEDRDDDDDDHDDDENSSANKEQSVYQPSHNPSPSDNRQKQPVQKDADHRNADSQAQSGHKDWEDDENRLHQQETPVDQASDHKEAPSKQPKADWDSDEDDNGNSSKQQWKPDHKTETADQKKHDNEDEDEDEDD